MDFKILGDIGHVETIATGSSLRDRQRLNKVHGSGHWRKLKGTARVELPDGARCLAELHWYEAHGIGAREHKIKRILE